LQKKDAEKDSVVEKWKHIQRMTQRNANFLKSSAPFASREETTNTHTFNVAFSAPSLRTSRLTSILS